MLNLLGHIFKIIIVFTKSDKSFWGKIYFSSIYNIWKDMKIITSNLTKSRKSPCLDCEYPLPLLNQVSSKADDFICLIIVK